MCFHNVRFYTQWFVNVPLEKLRELTSLKWCHYKVFRKRLLQLGHSKCKLIVPSLEGIDMLRVKIIGDSERIILTRRMKEAEALQKPLPFEKKKTPKFSIGMDMNLSIFMTRIAWGLWCLVGEGIHW